MPRLRLSDDEAQLIESYRKNEGIEVAKNGKRVELEPQESTTKSNDYKIKGFTAIGLDGLLMNIQEYCDYYKLDHSKIRSYKLISHTAIPFYNIVFYEEQLESLILTLVIMEAKNWIMSLKSIN